MGPVNWDCNITQRTLNFKTLWNILLLKGFEGFSILFFLTIVEKKIIAFQPSKGFKPLEGGGPTFYQNFLTLNHYPNIRSALINDIYGGLTNIDI